jgi:hypothetical protein
MTQHGEGQNLANGWIHENTHFLEERYSTGGSAPSEQLVTQEHAPTRSTERGEGQPLVNSWLRENTHRLEAHNAARVSSWRIAGYTRKPTNWKEDTVQGGSDGGRQLGMQSMRTTGDWKRSHYGGQYMPLHNVASGLISHTPFASPESYE